MKVTLEIDMDTLRIIDELLRVPDKELFLKAVHADVTADPLAIRILKIRNILGLSMNFDAKGNSPATNGINPTN